MTEPDRQPGDGLGQDHASPDVLAADAVDDVAAWCAAADHRLRRAERRAMARFHRVVGDRDGVEFAMGFVDRAVRHRHAPTAAGELRAAVREGRIGFLPWVDRVLLRGGAAASSFAPRLVVPLARARLRQLVGHLFADARPDRLGAALGRHRDDGFSVNVNLLGEAVLGEAEAGRRQRQILDVIADPAVDHVSVKVSSLASQIDLWSFDATFERVSERLRPIYQQAIRTQPPTLVNLDMEEYRDVDLTVRLFTSLLDEPELLEAPAGIVLQAYLPDSFELLQDLVRWADARADRGGADIKIRLVKGANLAMERVDAELHGWPLATYPSKADVDANFVRCLDWVLTPEHTRSVRIGVASHNLFHVALAGRLATARGVSHRLGVEMLQGLMPAHGRVVRSELGDLLLYVPTVGRADLDVATSYLFRRLEETAAPGNFLPHLMGMHPGSAAFEREVAQFRRSVFDRRRPAVGSRRDPAARSSWSSAADGFENEPDTDPSTAAARTWIAAARSTAVSPARQVVTDDPADVAAELVVARAGAVLWRQHTAADRREVLRRAADALADRREELLATMAEEANKIFAESDPEISEAVDFARWYGNRALELEELTDVDFEPLGVLAVVPPWNFPVAIPAGGVFAGLAAGNAVVLKPAPETPRCAEIVAEACWEAGVPRDVLRFVRTDDDDAGRAVVTGVDGVILTGSAETARLFRGWRPDLRLFAETSGKNALVVTPRCDHDQAVADLVRSAFGHAGQKCSAASLGILVGPLAEDQRFLGKLVDAAGSLRVGPAGSEGATMGPLIGPPTERLRRALTGLDPGQEWLLEPRQLAGDTMWTPGIIRGVAPGSWFHRTECFGPVLGLMTARDLDHALELQNATDFGLTGGIHSLDPDEVEHWLERVQVGNAYVNRHITGAVVARQPFGGWRGSVVGSGAKAGGPDHLLQLGTWRCRHRNGDLTDDRYLAAARASDEHWMAAQYGVRHDPVGLACEENALRYCPRPDVIVRAGIDAGRAEVLRTLSAARQAQTPVRVSVARRDMCDVDPSALFETDEELAAGLGAHRFGRIRMVGSAPPAVRAAAVSADVDVVDAPVTVNGRLELRWYLREQAISRTTHRYGTGRWITERAQAGGTVGPV